MRAIFFYLVYRVGRLFFSKLTGPSQTPQKGRPQNDDANTFEAEFRHKNSDES